MAIFKSEFKTSLRGLPITGKNTNQAGEARDWDGVCTDRARRVDGQYQILVMSKGPHWLNRDNFTGQIGAWKWENGKHVAEFSAPKAPVQAPVTCEVNGKKYIAQGNKWVPVTPAPVQAPATVTLGGKSFVVAVNSPEGLNQLRSWLTQVQVSA